MSNIYEYIHFIDSLFKDKYYKNSIMTKKIILEIVDE